MTQAIEEKTKLSVEGLSYAALESKSVNYDFSQGYAEQWELVVAKLDPDNEADAKLLVDDGYGEPTEDSASQELDGWYPMMNYYYPLPNAIDDADKVRETLQGLPLTLVYFNETEDSEAIYALALTGGGMDLTWEIAEAYIRLGYYPPLQYCGLPRMAMSMNPDRRAVLEGCKLSAKAGALRASNLVEDLAHVESYYKKEEAKA